MPAKPRRLLVNADEVELFHCYTRCVRRAFLCGDDPYTGKNYDHRKAWIRTRLEELSGICAVDVGWYAVLDNHLHVILRTRPDVAAGWTPRQVVQRACRLFPDKFRKLGVRSGRLTRPQLREFSGNRRLVKKMRKRLSSISWLMGKLCRWLAVKANEEDEVSGHFWEGRFRSNPILDETGLLICGVYVDLNWVRAGKARTPETSRYTSVADRIRGREARRRRDRALAAQLDGWLSPLQLEGDDAPYHPSRRASERGMLSISLEQYLQIVDWSGRQVRQGKGGAIPPDAAPILERLGMTPTSWLESLRHFPEWFKTAVGSMSSLRDFAQRLGQRWLRGASAAARALNR